MLRLDVKILPKYRDQIYVDEAVKLDVQSIIPKTKDKRIMRLSIILALIPMRKIPEEQFSVIAKAIIASRC